MNTDGLQGEVINIGMENEMTIRTLADIVVDICDTDSELVYESLPEDDPRKRRPDISKARTLLNWEPEVSLAKGLKHTLEYFQTHEYLVPHDASSPANDV